MIGAGYKQAIVTLVERKSGMALLGKVPFKQADLVVSGHRAKTQALHERGQNADTGQREGILASPTD